MRLTIPRARSPSNYTPKPLQHFLQKGVMFIMKKNKTRIGALLMAMVMIFTMLPLNTMAAFVGSETGTEIVDWPGGNANVDKGYGAVWGQFTRFTLVKLNFAHNDPQISDPAKLKDLGATEIIGSIDVAPNNLTGKTGYGVGVTKTDAEKVNTWWDTNALSYLIAAENGGTDGVSRAQNVWSYAEKSMNADTKNSANSWVSEQFLTYEELLNKLTISDSSAPANLPVWGAQGLGSNYLASIFSDSSNTGDSGLGQNGQSNEFFDQFLRVISKRKVTAKEFGDIHGTKESGGYTYRLLVEPGWVMAINGNRCAATLRDMAAYVVSEWDAYSLKYLGGHTNGTGIPSASAGGKLWYAHYNGSRQLAYGLFTGQDEFFAYQWADGSSTPLPVDSEGKTVFMKPVENTSSAKNDAAYNLGWFAGTMFGIGGNGIRSTADASYSTAKYSVGQCVGYGLGIVSPYDFKPNGLTVEKVLAGDIEPSMIDHEWEFSLHYNDGARPNNVVLTANGNAVAKEDTSDGFKFKVRADAPVNITFERDDSSDHIFYYIEETDPQATNYAQSIKLPDTKKDGYVQEGWVDENGNPVTEEDIKNSEEPITVKPAYFASIIMDANGGKVNGKDRDEVRLSTLATLPALSRNNYTFNGWFSEKDGGVQVDLEALKAANLHTTIWAHWTYDRPSGGGGGGGGVTITDPKTPLAPLLDVTFKVEGQDDKVVSTPRDSLVTPPKNVAPVGYKVIGWYTDEKMTKEWDLSKDKVTEDMILWGKLVYLGPFAFLTSDHIAYIQGMPDGRVYPEANITRAEVAMIFYRLLNDETRDQYKTSDNAFADVNGEDWFNVAVSTLANMGILKGRGSDLFDPNANITRAEFAVICSRVDVLDESEKVSFPDVSATHWASKEIRSAAAKGWVKGYDNGMFGPEDHITRAAVVTLINRMLNRATELGKLDMMGNPSNGDKIRVYPDSKNPYSWFYVSIQEATHAHDHEMKGDVEAWIEIHAPNVSNK